MNISLPRWREFRLWGGSSVMAEERVAALERVLEEAYVQVQELTRAGPWSRFARGSARIWCKSITLSFVRADHIVVHLFEELGKSCWSVFTSNSAWMVRIVDKESGPVAYVGDFWDRYCEICQRTKITRAPCRRRNVGAVPRAEKFGDLIKADHKVLSDNCESRNNHRKAVVVQDLATQWIQAYPCKTKTSQETQRSLQKFLEPERNPKVIYTDNSLEFGKACEDLSWNHCTSTPHRSETNGIAERTVRRVKEGTSAVLLQSGLDESWWADSMECYTYLRNVTDLLSDGKTPYERRFGKPFEGQIIPFGSLVECHFITAKDQSRIHQFGKKVLPGLFLGYAPYAGGIWKGDILVADLEELETMDASEIYLKRLNAKEVIFPKEKGEFIFHPQMDEPNFLEEIRTWEHPPWYGNVQIEEKVT